MQEDDQPAGTHRPAAINEPPDPVKIQALLDMAAMQSRSTPARKPPYKPLLIVTAVTVVLAALSYVALQWMAVSYQ